MTGWFKVHSLTGMHPATSQVTDSALGYWLRMGCWLADYPDRGDFIPEVVAKRFGSKRQIAQLVGAGLWEVVDDGYRVRKSMTLAGSGLASHFWAVDRSNARRPIPDSLRRAVYERDNFACVTCKAVDDLSLDHIHPWSLGGEDTFDNLQTLCRPCNSRKGARI